MHEEHQAGRVAGQSRVTEDAAGADLDTRCPPWTELIRLREGNLTPEEYDRLTAHVTQCPSCGAWACHHWKGKPETQLSGIQARLGTFRLLLHHRQVLFATHFSRRPKSHVTVAIVCTFFLTVYLVFQTYAVAASAEQLVNRAMIFERSRPLGLRQHVRYRFRPIVTLTSTGVRPEKPRSTLVAIRQLADGTVVELPSAVMKTGDEPVSIDQLLQRVQLDSREPLSMQRFQAWRGGLAHKHDQVIRNGDLETLHTTTTDSILREAWVTVKRGTGEVVSEALVFDGIGRIDIEEVAQWVDRTPVETQNAAARAAASTAAAEADLLQQAELDARLVLRSADLDLTGQVRVAPTTDAIRVEGIVSTPLERRLLATRLAEIRRVEVALQVRDSLDNAAATDAGASPSTVSDAAMEAVMRHPTPPRTALARWLDRTFAETDGGKATFVPTLERQMVVTMQHLAALQSLGQRYTDAETRSLSALSRTKLQQLLDSHYRALNVQLDGLNAQFSVLFGSTSRSFASSRAPADWRRRTQSSLTHAAVLDHLLHDLLSHEDLSPVDSTSQDQTSVRQAFDDLWEAINSRQARPSRLSSSE